MKKYEDVFNRNKIPIFIGFGVVVILFLSLLVFLSRRADQITLKYEFDGIVTKITYDLKDDPTVTIENQEYLLSRLYWQTNHEIEIGDSLKKPSGSMRILLIKRSRHETILFY